MKKNMKKKILVERDVSEEVLKYDPSSYPLLVFLKNIRYKESGHPLFAWFHGGNKEDNHLQIFKTNFSKLKDKKKMAVKHLRDIEQILWYGHLGICYFCCNKRLFPRHNRSECTTRKTRGVIQFLENKRRVYSLKGKFSLKDFYDFLREGFVRSGSDRKFLFVDKSTFKYLNKLFDTKSVFLCGAKKKRCFSSKPYCFDSKNVEVLVSPFGTVNIVKSPTLVDGSMCLLDMSAISYRYMRGRDTFLKVQSKKDRLKLYHYYLTDCGLMIDNYDYHLLGIIK